MTIIKCVECSSEGPIVAKEKCRRCYNREYMRKYQKAYRKKNPWVAKRDFDRHTERTYGITAAKRQEMLEVQEGRCAICVKPLEGPGHLDHNHSTKKVRQLLCTLCNKGLGLFHEDFDRLLAAAKYLQNHEGIL